LANKLKNWILRKLGHVKVNPDYAHDALGAVVLNSEPDCPQPFGYKTTWYTIKGETTQSVIDKLGLEIIGESNWETGIEYTQCVGGVFVSPQLNGYVLVINAPSMKDAGDYEHTQVQEHGTLFDELQYFGSHRVSDYYAWIKFVNRKLIRAYCYADVELWVEGAITEEELQLGFGKFPISRPGLDAMLESDDFSYDSFPDEESVLSISKAWGLDTTFADSAFGKSTGYVCKFTG